jgi:hypothetical protein
MVLMRSIWWQERLHPPHYIYYNDHTKGQKFFEMWKSNILVATWMWGNFRYTWLRPEHVYLLSFYIKPGFVWVWNMVSHIVGGTQPEGVREQDADKDILAWETRGNMGVEKTT